MRSQPNNLTILEEEKSSQKIKHLSAILKSRKNTGAHFTNGTYAYSAELIVPTTLAGFEYVNSLKEGLPMILAINSDESMKALGKENFEPQLERAKKVALPLAKKFPGNQVIVLFYNEKTPTELYESLSKLDITTTLHKWGYGTKQNEPKIEGADSFKSVYAFPLPNDTKPVCYYDTALPNKPQKITVVDLRSHMNKRKALLSTDRKPQLPTLSLCEKIKTFAFKHRYTLFATTAAIAAVTAYATFSSSNSATDKPEPSPSRKL